MSEIDLPETEAAELLDYYELEAELKAVDALAGAGEAHGIVCGQLAGGFVLEGIMWLKQFLMAVGVKREPAEPGRHWFYRFHRASRYALQNGDFSFLLLLPDDTEPMAMRLHQLSEWCSGFLAGFGSSGSRDEADFSAEIREILQDLIEISRVDTESGTPDDETDENHYAELVEYVRMAAVMIYTEFGLRRDDGWEGGEPSPVLH